ncbi:MAG: hypothetical protein HZB19_08110 [Chloroflexi bacterium]|nr:hypothetical protein [Chloroflexota bacterium]
MAKKDVTPVNGKFKIKGKDNRDLTLEFVNSGDTDTHIVEEKTDNDVFDKLPTPLPTWQGQPINWFANFSVYNKKDGKKNGYANVEYYITVSLEEGKMLFFYYDGGLHDATDELRKNGRVKLNVGDPGSGAWP